MNRRLSPWEIRWNLWEKNHPVLTQIMAYVVCIGFGLAMGRVAVAWLDEGLGLR